MIVAYYPQTTVKNILKCVYVWMGKTMTNTLIVDLKAEKRLVYAIKKLDLSSEINYCKILDITRNFQNRVFFYFGLNLNHRLWRSVATFKLNRRR